MGFINDYMQGVAMRRNPALLQDYLAQQRATQMADSAENIYGSRGLDEESEYQNIETEGPMLPGQEPGIMGVNQIIQEATPGTGMFNESIPERDRMMLMNKRMLGSGISGFNKQWMQNQGNMQNSMMNQIGASNLQRRKQEYDAANPTGSSAMKEYGLYRKQGGQMNFMDWDIKRRKAGSTKLNIDSGGNRIKPEHAAKMVNKKGHPVNVGVDDTYNDAASRGWTYGHQMTAEEAKQESSMAVSLKMSNDLLNMLDKGMDLSGFEGWAEGQRAGAGLSNIALDKALNTFGYTSDPMNVKAVAISENLSNTVLQALRGAAVGPAEQERVDRQLPRPGQPLEVFRENIKLTVENLKMIQSVKSKARGTGNQSESKVINFEDLK